MNTSLQILKLFEKEEYQDKILVGGAALVKLGSSRRTPDTDYLIDDISSKEPFIFDKENKIDYLNANGNKFFKEIYKKEKGRKIASPQSLLELKSYALVQHFKNLKWQKADDAEYDIKFLIRKFKLKPLKIVNKYITDGQLQEINKIIDSVKNESLNKSKLWGSLQIKIS